MQTEELRQVILGVLVKIAPELDQGRLRPDAPLRDQMDLDSMDWLNVFESLHRALGVDIPEADYARVQTLEGMLAYFGERLQGRS
jgi:acyl carrier protein